MSEVTEQEYEELSNRLRAANHDLQTLIEDNDESDLSELEMRAFDQGFVACLSQFLPFAVNDRIMFDNIKRHCDDSEATIKERREDSNAETDE